MPTYAYKCSKCAHQFDTLHSISASPLKTCPSCHQEALVRGLGGGSGVSFKGSGFYINDYKGSAPSLSSLEAPTKPAGSCCPCHKSGGGSCS